MQNGIKRFLALGISLLGIVLPSTAAQREFFAFAFGFPEWNPAEKVGFLHKSGYDGIAPNVWNDELLDEYKHMLDHPLIASGEIKVYGVYLPYRSTNESHRELLSRLLVASSGLKVPLWITLDQNFANDQTAVPFLKDICKEAHTLEIDVILYPHDNTYLLDVDDTLRVLKKADQPNLFTSLHLHHELRAGNADELSAIVKRAAPYTRLAVVSGSNLPENVNPGSRDWSDVVQPLSGSAYDVGMFYKLLTKNGFEGPIGLMNFKIPGDPKVHHRESLTIMQGWSSNKPH